MTERSDNIIGITNHSHGAGHGPSDLFGVVDLATGIAAADEQLFAAHPDQSELLRPIVAEEIGTVSPEATDVYVYPVLFFDGTRTGVRHRMLLHRVERTWDDDEPLAALAGVRS